MAGKKGQKKRFWSDDEKRLICSQARVCGVSVAQVARRYAMNANLVHTWLRDPRFSADEGEGGGVEGGIGFLPVELSGVDRSAASAPLAVSPPALGAPLSAQRVDLTLSDGRRILVEGRTSLSAVLALVEGFMQ